MIPTKNINGQRILKSDWSRFFSDITLVALNKINENLIFENYFQKHCTLQENTSGKFQKI